MDEPHIDVLLPVLSARATLPEAVDDLLAQQGVSVRVLAVVDKGPGGEDDGSAAWLAARARDEPRLFVLPGPAAGPAAALDLALATSGAPLIAHMEADDRCPPERLARLHAGLLAAAPDGRPLAGITSQAQAFGARTGGMARYLAWQNALLTHADMARERFVEIPALHQTGLYRREALLEVGGYAPRGPWPLDIDFWFRWFEHELPVAKLPEALYRWRQHPGQSTRTGPRHDAASLRAAKIDALVRLHGRAGREPRAIRLVSTGRTLETWRAALEAADVGLAETSSWTPGDPAPDVRDDGALLLAVYGMQRARDALRRALPALREPYELLFAG